MGLNTITVTYSIAFKYFRLIAECERSISRTSFNGNGPSYLYMLALSVYWMVCYQSVPGRVHGMRFCGYETSASWEENWNRIYAGIRTQKYSKHDKEKSSYTNSLDW